MQEDKPRTWINWVGLAVLALSYAVALSHMLQVKREEHDPGKIVLRMTHWQLETGIREAIDHLARTFEKQYRSETGKDVRIIQNPISERAYRQYIQTQCIGRTAPDLIEIGFYDQAYTTRFFLSNTEDAAKPNPYNIHTALEGVPWADTYYDGMQGSLNPDNLEMYGAGLSTVTVRLFYNKELFRNVLGHDRPPRDFAEFMEICERFQRWAEENGRDDFVPIAASKYQLDMFKGRIAESLFFDYLMEHDQMFDGGFSSSLEVFDSYISGAHSFDDEPIRRGHELLARITSYFPPGFMSQDRMESGFRFTQGNAAFITSGTWDAMSYFIQSDFPIGVMDFPLPTKEDPTYGRFVSGRISEAGTSAGLRFGITKFSKHPDVALKFLQFLTSLPNNEEFNRMCKWIPVIRGARPHPLMEPFLPKPEGVWGGDPFRILWNGQSRLVYDQALWSYVEHKTTFEQFIEEIEQEMPRAYAVDLERFVSDRRERRILLNIPLSWNRAIAVFGDTWGRNPDTADRNVSKAQRKLKYMWESRPPYYEASYWLLRWRQRLEAGRPRALEVQKYVKANLGT